MSCVPEWSPTARSVGLAMEPCIAPAIAPLAAPFAAPAVENSGCGVRFFAPGAASDVGRVYEPPSSSSPWTGFGDTKPTAG